MTCCSLCWLLLSQQLHVVSGPHTVHYNACLQSAAVSLLLLLRCRARLLLLLLLVVLLLQPVPPAEASIIKRIIVLQVIPAAAAAAAAAAEQAMACSQATSHSASSQHDRLGHQPVPILCMLPLRTATACNQRITRADAQLHSARTPAACC
jgi:hypothetical protein